MACCKFVNLFLAPFSGGRLIDSWAESLSVLIAFSSISSWIVCTEISVFSGIEVGSKVGSCSVFACSNFSPSCLGVGDSEMHVGGLNSGVEGTSVSPGGSQANIDVSGCTIETVGSDFAISFVLVNLF